MEQKSSRLTTSSLLFMVILGSFYFGFSVGKNSHSSININISTDTPEKVDFSPFWKAWGTIDQNFVAATTSASSTQKRIWGAISGMTSSLGDPYTVFLPPQENQNFNDEISGSFGGVGMEMGIQNNEITVIAPLKGTPAHVAGVKAGDVLLKVNDTDISGLSLEKVIGMIRGKKDTPVSITIGRKGAPSPMTFKLIRTTIKVPTIETNISQSALSNVSSTTITRLNTNGIFLITLYTFTADSAHLFREALKQFVSSGDHKLIIDLRGNPGGYLDAAVDMASWFLPASDIVVREQYADGHQDVFQSKGYDSFESAEIVILVDGGSASASEIFSGALSEHHKAILVGAKTFGKGSVQELFTITSDTSLKVTIAKWLTPNGVSISEKGIVPDFVVPISADDAKAHTDPQMDKAIEILSALN